MIQGVIGTLYYIGSANLMEDLTLDMEVLHNKTSPEDYKAYIDDKFNELAWHCWFGAGFMVLSLVLSFLRFLCVKNRLGGEEY